MAKPTVSIAAAQFFAEHQTSSDILNNLVQDIATASALTKGALLIPTTAFAGGTAAAGAALTGTIAVVGAAIGDLVLMGYSVTIQTCQLYGFVTSAGTVTWSMNLTITGQGVVAAGSLFGLVVKQAQLVVPQALVTTA